MLPIADLTAAVATAVGDATGLTAVHTIAPTPATLPYLVVAPSGLTAAPDLRGGPPGMAMVEWTVRAVGGSHAQATAAADRARRVLSASVPIGVDGAWVAGRDLDQYAVDYDSDADRWTATLRITAQVVAATGTPTARTATWVDMGLDALAVAAAAALAVGTDIPAGVGAAPDAGTWPYYVLHPIGDTPTDDLLGSPTTSLLLWQLDCVGVSMPQAQAAADRAVSVLADTGTAVTAANAQVMGVDVTEAVVTGEADGLFVLSLRLHVAATALAAAATEQAPTLDAAATFGVPTVTAQGLTQTVTPTGLDAAPSYGSLDTGATVTVTVSALDAAAGFGAVALAATVTVTASGLDAPATFGAVDTGGAVTVTATGLAAGATFGAAATAAAATVTPSGLDAAPGMGTPGTAAGPVTVTAAALDAEATFGALGVLAGTTATPSGLDAAATVGGPTVTPGPVTVTPTGLDAEATVGALGIAATATAAPSGLDAAASYGTVTAAPGAVTVTAAGLDAAPTFGTPGTAATAAVAATGLDAAPTMGAAGTAAGPVTVTPAGLDAEATVGALGVAAAFTATASGLDASAVFGTVTAAPGAVTATPAGLDAAATFGSPAASPGTVSVAPTGHTAAATFGSPTVEAAAGGASVLLLVGNEASLTTGDTTLTDALEAGGYTVTARSYSSSELTSGYDLHVLAPSIGSLVGATKYDATNAPTLACSISSWNASDSAGQLVGVLDAGATAAAYPSAGVSYVSSTHIVWTGQTDPGASGDVNVTLGTAPPNGDRYRAVAGDAAKVAEHWNGPDGGWGGRHSCIVLPAGSTRNDGGGTSSHRAAWLGWAQRIDNDNLGSAGEQFIVDLADWLTAFTPAAGKAIWLLGSSVVTANVFADSGEEASADLIEALGHTVTRHQSSTVTTAPTTSDCDLVIHMDGSVGGEFVLRATEPNSAPVIACNTYYWANASGHTCLATGPTGTGNSDADWEILDTTEIAWTDGYSVSTTVAVWGYDLYQEAVQGVVSGSIPVISTVSPGHDTCVLVPSGTANIAGTMTVNRVALFNLWSDIDELNTAGGQILDDVIGWATEPHPRVASYTVEADLESGASTSLVIDQPAGLADGDVLYLFVQKDDDQGDPFTATGFTSLVQDQTVAGRDSALGILRKVVTDASSEPATYTVAHSGSADYMTATLIAVRGIDTTAPENAIGSVSVNSSTEDWWREPVTTTTDGCLVLGYIGQVRHTGSFSSLVPPTDPEVGTVINTDAIDIGSVAQCFHIFTQATAGSTGDAIVFTGGTDNNSPTYRISIALEPA